jgi:hypothetical protein
MIKINKPNFRNRNLVYGVGINDWPTSTKINGKAMPEYDAWHSMLERCYSPKYPAKRPTYIGCTVDPVWHRFTVFYNWLHDNSFEKGLHLDKDILVEGNKVYSPETCCLVPIAINLLLNDHGAARGDYPQGVTWDKLGKKFKAQVTFNNKKKHIGYFTTVEEAESAYLKVKAKVIKETVDQHALPADVIEALYKRANELLTRSINITLTMRAA